MTELFFPVVGTLLVFLVAVPCLTAVSVALLRYVPQLRGAVDASGSPLRFALIVGPTLVPVLWMASAALHQSEGSAPLAACIVDHLSGKVCADVAFFGSLLLAILGLSVVRRARAEGPCHCRRVARPALAAARQRVLRVCFEAPALSKWHKRIHVVETGVAPACTRGLLLPHVELELETVETLTEDELLAVLLHEVEHAQARDPLRLFVAQVALSLNPLRSLLAAELRRYAFAREALCDRGAVQNGAEPLSLARSIVAAAAHRPVDSGAVGLGGPPGGAGIAGVRLRVQLLLGYAAHHPKPAPARCPVGLATLLCCLLVVLPHISSTGPLDLLHHGVERAALSLGLG